METKECMKGVGGESYYAFAHYGVHLQERLHLYELHLGTAMGVSQCVCAHVCLYKPSLPSRYRGRKLENKDTPLLMVSQEIFYKVSHLVIWRIFSLWKNKRKRFVQSLR